MGGNHSQSELCWLRGWFEDAVVPHASLLVSWRSGETGQPGQVTKTLQGEPLSLTALQLKKQLKT